MPLLQEKICIKFSVKRKNQNHYQIVNQDYISWIARAMGNILASQKRGYFQDFRRLLSEPQQDIMSRKWESSGSTEHTEEYHGEFDWLHSKTVRISSNIYERKIRQGLEISKLKKMN